MRRYYFDIREGAEIFPDEEGLEFSTIEEEAALSLADMARDAVRSKKSNLRQEMAIEVRDDHGPVLQLKFLFEVDRRTQ
jgi:hypothetical protein